MTRRFDVYAPLQDFYWSGQDQPFGAQLVLKRFNQTPSLSGLEAYVSKPEWDRAVNSDHWLTFQWVDGTKISTAEMINLFLLSLWLVKPTRAQVALRFEIGRDEAAGQKRMSRLLDRFSWIPGSIEPDISDEDVQKASTYYGELEKLCGLRGRLNNAMALTVSGCWSHAWQTALICHAAAAETILTYSTALGLTRRLATSYACIVASDTSARDAAFNEFTNLYSARSDITHGRMHNIPEDGTLPTLSRFANLMRGLWSAVLRSKELMAALELDDAGRRAHFTRAETGYSPPKP